LNAVTFGALAASEELPSMVTIGGVKEMINWLIFHQKSKDSILFLTMMQAPGN